MEYYFGNGGNEIVVICDVRFLYCVMYSSLTSLFLSLLMKKCLIILSIFISTNAAPQTVFGLLVSNHRIESAKLLGLDYIRVPVNLSMYHGENILKQYYDNGINNIILTVQWNHGVDTFTRDTSRYKLMLDNFVKINYTQGKGLFLVVGNEELNRINNFGYAADYVNLLKAAASIAEKYNLKISDGGLTFSTIKLKIFFSMRDAHAANSFAATCIPSDILKKLQNPKYNTWTSIHYADTVIDAIRKITYQNFYVNFHYYAPALYRNKLAAADTVSSDNISILLTLVKWLKDNTGKPLICGEMGQLNTSPDLCKTMLTNAVAAGLPLVIWKAGDDGDSYGLFDGLKLRSNGVAFKTFIAGH
jgi:hypothetical protein